MQATHESRLPYFGAVAGPLFEGHAGVHEIRKVLEKPTPTDAEQRLMTPGLRHGHYLCFLGMHVLTPAIMDLLEAELQNAPDGQNVSLSSSLSALAQRERHSPAQLIVTLDRDLAAERRAAAP